MLVNMGFKRPFDDVDFQELPFKHPRQLEFSDKLAPFSDAVSCYGAPRKTYVSGEDGNVVGKSQWLEVLEKYTVNENSTPVNKVIGAPFSLTTRSCREEDVGPGPDAYLPPAGDFEFDFPRRTFVPFKDVYSSLADRSPRKPVPVGPDHQARIPTWTGRVKCLDQTDESNRNRFSLHSLESEKVVNNASEEKLLGTSVIPMPDSNLSTLKCDKVGLGRTDCSCLDPGTVRCVQKHVMDAREELRRTLGNEKFVKLGFCDMGEEVARSGVKKKRRPSLRRAVQNRSNILEIDSDDDEWHGDNGGSIDRRVAEYDEDSVIESRVYQDDHVDHEEDYSDEDDSDDDDVDDDGSDGDGDGGHVKGDSSEEDGGIDNMESYMLKTVDDGKFDIVGQHGEKTSGCTREEFDFQDDSCVSFEFQSNMHDSCDRIDAGAAGSALQVTGFRNDRSKCLHGQPDASSDVVGHAYLLEPCDAKVWDARFPLDAMKGVDVLPTWSMIEEIFDEGMGDYKTRDEQKGPASG
ncbi:hypothetical protein Prudu_605S000500 [Prunus dulcis]|uniref:ELM2 domain-containing protein n=1 Tax=Prunus dulcis TaxID=3755 RepID=A0A5H2XL18_PRUDU|nr:hypothetical protein Prudu_605S000500 [Prunus dulcis]